MLYLNEKDILKIGIDWNEIVNELENTVHCLQTNEFSQPIKPYLRYGDPKNRIIAMPAYVGGNVNIAGIKWIASFPDNINNKLPRAHSVVILNDANTGKPVSILNTPMISIIRTASVSSLLIKYYFKARQLKPFNLGIIGWGPIGKHHLKMCMDLYGEYINKVFIYDLNPIDAKTIESSYLNKVTIAESWKDVYVDSDVFITCTVSKSPYIDIKPKQSSLQLNVSLRDYKVDIYEYVRRTLIVDDWDEVCRENTDIENMHREKGLLKEDTWSIIDVVCNSIISRFENTEPVMFNPMGMAVFDVTVGNYYMKKALELNQGTILE